MLNSNIRRQPLTRSTLLAIVTAMLSVTLPLAALSSAPNIQSPSARVTGTVSDVAGETVARATVIVSTPDGRIQATAVTNETGAFVLSGLAPGAYVLQVFAPGFGPSRMLTVEVPEGRNVRQDVQMDIGFVQPLQPQGQNLSRLITINLASVELRDFFQFISDVAGLALDADPSITGKVTVRLTDVTWEQALDTVLRNYALTREVIGNTLRIRKNDLVRLDFELYKNGTLVASPRIAVRDQQSASLTQGGPQGAFRLSVTPKRLAGGKTELAMDLEAGGETSRSVFIMPNEDTDKVMWTFESGADSYELRTALSR